jgi:hypothetical protein
MKFKLPKIISYKVLVDEYAAVPEKIELKSGNSKRILFEEDKSAQKKREAVLDCLKKHEEALKEIELAMVAYAREMTIDFPQISLMTVKKRNDLANNEYYNARVMFPEYDGKYTEYRIYIGPKSSFPDLSDPNTMVMIQQKIALKIKEKRGWVYPTGEYKD